MGKKNDMVVGAAGFEPATSRTRTQWSKTPTADLTDPCFREPCGQLRVGNRVDCGCVINPSLVLFLTRFLVPSNECYQKCIHYTNLLSVSENKPPKILAAVNQEVGGLPTAIIRKKKTAILAEAFGIQLVRRAG